jgi:phosphomannomutase
MSDVIKFGTDGWRAIIAEDFTFANVERVAYAVGAYVKRIYHCDGAGSVPILIGYDTRFLADKFAHRAAQVLIGMGIPTKVSDRDVPTPCIAWATQHEPTAGALQFTASHNPLNIAASSTFRTMPDQPQTTLQTACFRIFQIFPMTTKHRV